VTKGNKMSFERDIVMQNMQIRNRLTMEVLMETNRKYLENVLGPAITKSGFYVSSIKDYIDNNSGKWVVIVDDPKKQEKNIKEFFYGKTTTVRVSIDPSVFKTDEEAVMFMMGGNISRENI
jgi:hypothetical protein